MKAPSVSTRALAAHIDHTLLDPAATQGAVERLCDEAVEHGFAAVCVLPLWVARCATRLAGTGVRVCTVVDFPLGASWTEVRVAEARRAADLGAGEVDAMIRLGALIAGELAVVREDLEELVRAARPAETKVILETGRLDRERTIAAARLVVESGATFVKTSTGFLGPGATVDQVKLLREVVGPTFGVKASGGIRTLDQARALLEAGATRLGTSAGVRLLEG